MKVFISRPQLEQAIRAAGFDIEESWQPQDSKSKGVFILARKAA